MFEHPRNFREKIRHTKTNYTSFTFYAFYKLGNAPNRFRPGLRSGPHWGSLQRSLRPLAGGEGARRVLPKNPTPPRPFGLRPYWLCCVVPQHPPKINPSYGLVEDVSLPGRFAAHSDRCSHGTWAEFGVEVWGLKQASAIGGGAGGGHRPLPMTGLGAPCTLGPPTLTPVDRNKTYCFHELVLNLPAPLDIQ